MGISLGTWRCSEQVIASPALLIFLSVSLQWSKIATSLLWRYFLNLFRMDNRLRRSAPASCLSVSVQGGQLRLNLWSFTHTLASEQHFTQVFSTCHHPIWFISLSPHGYPYIWIYTCHMDIHNEHSVGQGCPALTLWPDFPYNKKHP